MEFTQRQDAKTLLDRDDRRAERSRSEVQHLGMEAWPQTKGKIESTIRFIKSSFWPGLSFDSLAELNRQTRLWCDEVNRRLHGTTREASAGTVPARSADAAQRPARLRHQLTTTSLVRHPSMLDRSQPPAKNLTRYKVANTL